MPSPHTIAVVTALLRAQGHVLTTTQLDAAGLTPAQIRSLTAAGALLRLRRGVLVDRRWWDASAPWERHAVRARGFALALGATAGVASGPGEGRPTQPAGAEADPTVDSSPAATENSAAAATAAAVGAPLSARVGGGRPVGRLALSHHSALAVHGVSVHAVDDLVHMCRLDGQRGHRSGALVVHGPVDPDHVTSVEGLRTVSPSLACLQVAADFGPEAGLVAADSLLRLKLSTRDELAMLVRHSQLRAGSRAVRVVMDLADGRRESAGESRTAWLAHQLGLPALVPQVVITEEDGSFVARVDFVIEGTKVVVEFDGMLKYTEPGVLAAEKKREDRLRRLGYAVVRVTWEDLGRPDVVRARLLAALARDGRRAA